ncbi:hypothetical protein COY71_01720, partial [Candidatus Micrarchaeota archaeon CG_4_10_14_0_8_um_filter_60_7]
AGCLAESVEEKLAEPTAQSSWHSQKPQAPDLAVTGNVWPMMAAVHAKVKFTFTVVNEGPGNCSSFDAFVDLGDGYNFTRVIRADCRSGDCFGKGALKKFEFERTYAKWGYREIVFRATCEQAEASQANNEFKARLLVYPVG